MPGEQYKAFHLRSDLPLGGVNRTLNEWPNEHLARRIVSAVLAVPVDRFEDGKATHRLTH